MWRSFMITIVQAALFNCFAPLYNNALDERAAPIGANLVFAAFGHVNASCELDFEYPGEDRKLRNLLLDNSNVLVSLGWGKQDIPMIERCPLKFANSVAGFVVQNGLRGFDIDHEDPPFSSEHDFITVSTALRKALPPPLLLTISPASLYSVHIPNREFPVRFYVQGMVDLIQADLGNVNVYLVMGLFPMRLLKTSRVARE